MRNTKKGFTLIELLIVVVIVGILALAAIPLITANTRDARRAEGEQQLGSMKGQARVAFAKTGAVPTTLTGAYDAGGCNVDAAELVGKYFQVNDACSGSAGAATLTTATGPSGVSSDGNCTLTFAMAGGDGTFAWA
ncbi:MAG: type II secretion system protein [Planctomycetes bacterium]|nr:type II secretion system protein [Planctomycetota bacterium]MCW8134864.1 type II secretion system protein [Planctomycetota bacterium]